MGDHEVILWHHCSMKTAISMFALANWPSCTEQHRRTCGGLSMLAARFILRTVNESWRLAVDCAFVEVWGVRSP